jgi:sulfite oxidase
MASLIVHTRQPLNAEPPLPDLRSRFITPQGLFYVRSHGEIPRLDAATHRLEITGQGVQPTSFTLRALRDRFPTVTTTAVLQCAGNRRADLAAVRETSGDPWRAGAIGQARWTGVSLAAVLRAAGVDADRNLHVGGSADRDLHVGGDADRDLHVGGDADRDLHVGGDADRDLHVGFAGADHVPTDDGPVPYEVSIPLGKALAPDVLLAWAMNDEPLAPEHGFPLRAIVPNWAGVRSAKWLQRITLRDRPAPGPIQQQDYHLLPAGETDPHRGTPINAMPLNAAICDPAADSELPAGPLMLRGYALAAQPPVTRVEVTADDGIGWIQAALEPQTAGPAGWTFWQAQLTLPAGEHTLAVRAWDSAGQTMPARAQEVWNRKGYLCTAWHRIRVRVR